jgi:hypothetical protein
MLILNRASKSRLSGKWSDDDYGVFGGDQYGGRAMQASRDRQQNQ